jgi:hypothetical protein
MYVTPSSSFIVSPVISTSIVGVVVISPISITSSLYTVPFSFINVNLTSVTAFHPVPFAKLLESISIIAFVGSTSLSNSAVIVGALNSSSNSISVVKFGGN